MKIIEILLGLSLLAVCIITTKSDLEKGLIYNKTLMIFAVIALILDFIYYMFFLRELVVCFLLNLTIMIIINIVLFFTHSFAGGDCKLSIVLSMLYPAHFYWTYGSANTTLVFALGCALFYGYLYILVVSVTDLLKQKSFITMNYVKSYVMNFFLSFVIAMVYISGINLVIICLSQYEIRLNTWIVRLLCIFTAWLVGSKPIFRKWKTIFGMLSIDVILIFCIKVIPFSLNFENYIIVLLLLLCQMTIKTGLYEIVSVDSLKKGMILSTGTSLLFQGSRVRGLPDISSEDLRNRLTSEEVESIKRWATGKEVKEITIVKKIPFAVFIGLGFLTYFIIWSANV